MPSQSPSQNPDSESPQTPADKLKKDFSTEFVNGEPEIAKGEVKLEDLLEKFTPLLSTDIESYERAVQQIRFLDYDTSYLDKVITIGKPLLKTKDARAYVSITTRNLAYTTGWLQEREKKEQTKGIPDPQAFTQEIFEKVLADALPFMNQDLGLLLSVLDSTAKSFPDLLPQIDLTNLKGKDLDDKTFYIIAKYHKGYKTPEIVIKTAATLLLKSQEKPFANIVEFKRIASTVLRGYKTHKNGELVELVLRRGKEFTEGDPQTADYIKDKIEKSGYEPL
jgi:hypothetical protein